jgi:hypothetical protein
MYTKGMKVREETVNGNAIKSVEDFIQFLNSSDRFNHYVGILSPFTPGIKECINDILYTHFQPGSLQNNFFFSHTVNWCEMSWAVMSVLNNYENIVKKTANDCGLEARKGVFIVHTNKGKLSFLDYNEKMFVLDIPNNHIINRNEPWIEQILKDAEDRTVEKIVKSYKPPTVNTEKFLA